MYRILFIPVFFLFIDPVQSQTGGACKGGSFEIVKPFLGTWKEYTVTDNDEKLIGTLQSTVDLGGCTISQRFVSNDSSFSYLSFGYVEPSSLIWEETYVFSNGSISRYQWLIEGEDVLMRRTGGTRKMEYMHQLRLTNITTDRYDVIEEHSHNAGKTWEQKELTRVKRIE